MTPRDSAHWTHSQAIQGGVAMSSLDVRRAAMAAAWRKHHPNWAARWLFRWLVRLKLWRERLNRWGRPPGEGKTGGPQ